MQYSTTYNSVWRDSTTGRNRRTQQQVRIVAPDPQVRTAAVRLGCVILRRDKHFVTRDCNATLHPQPPVRSRPVPNRDPHRWRGVGHEPLYSRSPVAPHFQRRTLQIRERRAPSPAAQDPPIEVGFQPPLRQNIGRCGHNKGGYKKGENTGVWHIGRANAIGIPQLGRSLCGKVVTRGESPVDIMRISANVSREVTRVNLLL